MEALIVFAIIFVPFFWYIWVTLRYTRDTIGTNSPLKVPRIYHATPWHFFTHLEFIYSYYGVVLGSFFLKMAFTSTIPPGAPSAHLMRLVISVLAILMIGFSVFILIVALNHWKYTEGVTIETFPAEHTVTLTISGTRVVLKSNALTSIHIISNEGRAPLGYMIYHLSNGDHFILSDKMPGAWVIQEYFKQVPINYQPTRFPIIR